MSCLTLRVQNTKASIPKCRGFLVSCWGGKEQQAAREAIDLLTEVEKLMHYIHQWSP